MSHLGSKANLERSGEVAESRWHRSCRPITGPGVWADTADLNQKLGLATKQLPLRGCCTLFVVQLQASLRQIFNAKA